MSLGVTFADPVTPFYGGAAVSSESSATSVTLAGNEYPIDLPKYRHRGLPSFRDGVVTSGEPSDQLFDSQGAWWRYRFSFEHGAGQAVADLEEDGDPDRFAASRGIDPWTEYQACLLPSTTRKLVVSASNIYVTATATHLYVSDGSGVKRTASLAGTPTWTSITGMAGTVVGMTTDGTDCYIATATGIYQITIGSAAAVTVTTAVPNTAYNTIAFVANRLLAGDGELLVQIGPTSLTTIRDHYQSAFRWTAIFQVGSRIYVGGYAGNRSELFTTTTDEFGALVTSAEAASFFAGELILNALSYGGSVILGTSKGVRFATLGADGTLQYGPIIEAGGAAQCLAAEGRFAWFGWENFPDAGCGLGRLALDTFVDALQPAYATDVFTAAVNDTVTACARFGGRTVFAVAADGLYATSSTAYVTEGYIDTGEIYFGTVENKSITETRLRTEALAAGEAMNLEIVDAETGIQIANAGSSTDGAVSVIANADGVIVNRITARLTISGPGTTTPCIRQWRARAYPIGPPVEEWIVPLIIHSSVVLGDGDGRVKSYDNYDEVERLKEYWRSREVITFSIGPHVRRVRIDNFEHEPAEWTDDSDWFEGTLTVRLLSV